MFKSILELKKKTNLPTISFSRNHMLVQVGNINGKDDVLIIIMIEDKEKYSELKELLNRCKLIEGDHFFEQPGSIQLGRTTTLDLILPHPCKRKYSDDNNFTSASNYQSLKEKNEVIEFCKYDMYLTIDKISQGVYFDLCVDAANFTMYDVFQQYFVEHGFDFLESDYDRTTITLFDIHFRLAFLMQPEPSKKQNYTFEKSKF
jgi:hypothetical protein